MPAIFSHTGQIHQAVLDLIYNQIKLRLELIDPHTQGSKIQETLRFWLMQLSCVINRTAYRSILAGASSLVDYTTYTMLAEVCALDQCRENLAANSAAARRFIEDMELSMVILILILILGYNLVRQLPTCTYYYYYLHVAISNHDTANLLTLNFKTSAEYVYNTIRYN